jgi:hypothetical protein
MRRPEIGPSLRIVIAGAGLIHKPATADPPKPRGFAHRIEESWPVGAAARTLDAEAA